jgi:heme-degrading monooxygenase HmoA
MPGAQPGRRSNKHGDDVISQGSQGPAVDAPHPPSPPSSCPYHAGRDREEPSAEKPSTEALPSFVALSRFIVANGMTPEVKLAFMNRPHLVDDAPGFIRMDVISPLDNTDEIWLITFWSDEESYRQWHRGHTYRESHGGIPKGLRLDPKGTSIRLFDYVSS